MIIVDTNVISEPMSSNGNPIVQIWLDQQSADTLYLTTTSLSELLLGIEILPDGKRKIGLDAELKKMIERLFEARVLPFDQRAAMAYAPLIGRARAHGHSISVADGQIAAIAAIHQFTVATRDTGPFISAEIPVINPWEN